MLASDDWFIGYFSYKVNVIALIFGDGMAPDSKILASLDRALEESGACIIATKSAATVMPESLESQGIATKTDKPSLVAISPSTPLPSLTPSHTPSQTKLLLKAKAEAEVFLTRPWRKLWDHEKIARAFLVAEKAGGVSFTLNFSTRLQETLRTYSDPTRLVSHYINRELRRDFSIPFPYAFRFEVSPVGRLHIHGVLVPFSSHEDHLRPIEQALARAGGKPKASVNSLHKRKAEILQRNTQSYLGHLYDGLGWFAYCEKTRNEAAMFLGTNKVTFISTPLVKLCS